MSGRIGQILGHDLQMKPIRLRLRPDPTLKGTWVWKLTRYSQQNCWRACPKNDLNLMKYGREDLSVSRLENPSRADLTRGDGHLVPSTPPSTQGNSILSINTSATRNVGMRPSISMMETPMAGHP
jgi:hypothetical protein